MLEGSRPTGQIFRIRNPKCEAVIKAFETLPILPDAGTVTFSARNSKRTIPGTLNWEYASGDGLLLSDTGLSSDSAFNNVISGRRVRTHIFNMGTDYTAKIAYFFLYETGLQAYLDNGYQIRAMDICLKAPIIGPKDCEERRLDAGLKYVRKNRSSRLELFLGENLNTGDANWAMEWFHHLSPHRTVQASQHLVIASV